MSLLLQKFPRLGRLAASSIYLQQRSFNLQENVAYTILNEYGIKTPRFGVAKSASEAEKVARDLLTVNLMVKAQVLAGGRGLGKFKNGFKGGVRSAAW